MTLTLELPPELEKSLKDAAAKVGSQPSDFAVETLRKQLKELKLVELEQGYKELGEAQKANSTMYPSDTLDGIDLEDSKRWR